MPIITPFVCCCCQGHLTDFIKTIREYHPDKAAPSELSMKAALWAIGHIGTSAYGLPLLLEQGVLQDVVTICETSSTLSIKGTAFYILGLFSKTQEGTEALRKLGWEVILDKFNESRGIAFPMDLDKLLPLPPTEYRGSLPLEQLRHELPKEEDHEDPIASEIFLSVTNLSNHIVASSASKQLTKLRTEVPHYFARPELYHDVLAILYNYRYKLNAHRFIHELFDRVLLNEEALKHWNTPGTTRPFQYLFQSFFLKIIFVAM